MAGSVTDHASDNVDIEDALLRVIVRVVVGIV
jgi:hypothetical protein